MPTRFASSRFDQWVAPSGTSSRVRTTTSSTWASVMVRGTPGRGSSLSPSSRARRKRLRHLATVARLTPSRAATAMLGPPSAQASTIRARKASPCAVLRRLAQLLNVRRSAPVNTSGSSLLSPIPPAHRAGQRTGTPEFRGPAPAVTKGDSCGAERTQNRLTSHSCPQPPGVRHVTPPSSPPAAPQEGTIAMTVNGTVLDGFEAVRDAFGQAQADDEGAAQLAVYHQGQLMVDLWTGQDVTGGRPYTGDSISILMSVSKGMTAT